jgi:hypothetical protein
MAQAMLHSSCSPFQTGITDQQSCPAGASPCMRGARELPTQRSQHSTACVPGVCTSGVDLKHTSQQHWPSVGGSSSSNCCAGCWRSRPLRGTGAGFCSPAENTQSRIAEGCAQHLPMLLLLLRLLLCSRLLVSMLPTTALPFGGVLRIQAGPASRQHTKHTRSASARSTDCRFCCCSAHLCVSHLLNCNQHTHLYSACCRSLRAFRAAASGLPDTTSASSDPPSSLPGARAALSRTCCVKSACRKMA